MPGPDGLTGPLVRRRLATGQGTLTPVGPMDGQWSSELEKQSCPVN